MAFTFHLHLMFSTYVGYDDHLTFNFTKLHVLESYDYLTRPCFGCELFHSDCFAGPSAHLAEIRGLTIPFEGYPEPFYGAPCL